MGNQTAVTEISAVVYTQVTFLIFLRHVILGGPHLTRRKLGAHVSNPGRDTLVTIEIPAELPEERS